MKTLKILRGLAVTTACIGMLSPQATWASRPEQYRSPAAGTSRDRAPHSVVTDISLQQGGTLWGQVVDPQGHAVDGARVWLRQNSKVVAQAVADHGGRFKVEGLRGGVYHVVTSSGSSICRAWSVGSAPPSARHHLMLVSGPAIRAQEEYESITHYDGSIESDSQGLVPGESIPAEAYPPGPDGPYYPGPVGPAFGGPTFGHKMVGFLTSPWVVGALIAAAIAVPLAIDDDDNDFAS